MAHRPREPGDPAVIDVSDGTIPETRDDAILVCYGSHPGPCPVLMSLGHPVPIGAHGVVLAINERDAVHFAFADSYRKVLQPDTPLRLVNRRVTGARNSQDEGGIG